MNIPAVVLGLFVLTSVWSNPLNTQSIKQEGIPNFRIALTDSSYFNKNDLERKKKVMLIYFSPDCEHCNNFLQEIIHDYKKFNNVQVIMISNHPIPELKEFENKYQLRNYRNIKVGTEGRTFQIQRHYQVTRFPFIALFEKSGRSIGVYRDIPSIDVICQAFKKEK